MNIKCKKHSISNFVFYRALKTSEFLERKITPFLSQDYHIPILRLSLKHISQVDGKICYARTLTQF